MAAIDAYTNFAYSKVFAPPTVPLSGTSLSLAAGTSARLPAVPFNAARVAGDRLSRSDERRDCARHRRRGRCRHDGARAGRHRPADHSRRRCVRGHDHAEDARRSARLLNQNSGILPDARLSPNVPLINNANGTYQPA